MQLKTLKVGIPTELIETSPESRFPDLSSRFHMATLSMDLFYEKPIYQQINRAIIDHNLDAAIVPLHTLPVQKDHSLVIAALSKRHLDADILFIKQAEIDYTRDFRIPARSRVLVAEDRLQTQLRHYRPDLIIEVQSVIEPMLSASHPEHTYSAILVPGWLEYSLHLDTGDYQRFELNPEEIIPVAGSGCYAFVCLAENLPVRKILAGVHSEDTSVCTNIERGLKLRMPEDMHHLFFAYANRDTMNNFHVHLAMGGTQDYPFKKLAYSSSTSFGIVDQVMISMKN